MDFKKIKKYWKKLSKDFKKNKVKYMTYAIIGGIIYTLLSFYYSIPIYWFLQLNLKLDYTLFFTFIPYLIFSIYSFFLYLAQLISPNFYHLFSFLFLTLFYYMFLILSILSTGVFGVFITINIIYLLKRFFKSEIT